MKHMKMGVCIQTLHVYMSDYQWGKGGLDLR